MNLRHLILILFLFLSISVFGQERKWEDIDTTGYFKKQVTTRGPYTLIFINKDPAFNPETGKRLTELFFLVYPKEVADFNPKSIKTVTFVISSEYRGVAATYNGVVKFDPAWFQQHPEDIDCATHELMHVVQDYHGDNPGWLVEGIADYGRHIYGINNLNAGWKLSGYHQGQLYTNAYQITAAFLLWVEHNYKAKVVEGLNEAMRKNKYTADTWIKLTGKSVDELWNLYTQS